MQTRYISNWILQFSMCSNDRYLHTRQNQSIKKEKKYFVAFIFHELLSNMTLMLLLECRKTHPKKKPIQTKNNNPPIKNKQNKTRGPRATLITWQTIDKTNLTLLSPFTKHLDKYSRMEPIKTFLWIFFCKTLSPFCNIWYRRHITYMYILSSSHKSMT